MLAVAFDVGIAIDCRPDFDFVFEGGGGGGGGGGGVCLLGRFSVKKSVKRTVR